MGGAAYTAVVWRMVLPVVLAFSSAAHGVSVDMLLGGGRLVVYGARSEPDAPPRPARLAADARVLHRVGFRAVTTLATTRANAPACRFFKRAGFRTVLVGIADPDDEAELRRAIHLRRCVDGYVIGDGGLAGGRYDLDAVVRAIRRVTKESGRPVTTREPVDVLARDPTLVRLGDWVFATLDPFAAGHSSSQDACGFVISAYRALAEKAPAGIPTVLAATGLPTAGDPKTSEHYQRAFFLCLESRQVAFGHFLAFDQPERADGPTGPHWGLFRADGTPKLWAAQELRVTLEVARTARTVEGRVPTALRSIVRVVAYVQQARWELLPDAPIDANGMWRIEVGPERPVTVFAVTTGWSAPESVERLPVIDRAHVLARRDVPPL